MRNRFWVRAGASALLVGAVLLTAGEAGATPPRGATRFSELSKILTMLGDSASGLLDGLLHLFGREGLAKSGSDFDPNGSGTAPVPDQGGSDLDPDGAPNGNGPLS